MCGDYFTSSSRETVKTGLPPRVRGLPFRLSSFFLDLRITPACAGTTLCWLGVSVGN